MKIQKFKKIGLNKYKVFFDNSEIVLYEDVIIKYNLLILKNIDMDFLNTILKENAYYEVYNLGLKYIGIKMRNKKELFMLLNKKGFDMELINTAIEDLDKKGYLSDESYVNAFINDKINLSNFGPNKIKQDLLYYDLDEYLINKYLYSIKDGVWIEKVQKYINKKKKVNKNSLNVFKMKMMNELYNLGYESELIERCLENIKTDESSLINKEYEKAYRKYSKKYSDSKLYMQIKNYLYRKMYSVQEINKIMHEKTEE